MNALYPAPPNGCSSRSRNAALPPASRPRLPSRLLCSASRTMSRRSWPISRSVRRTGAPHSQGAFKMTLVLVTGGTGHLGQDLVRTLLWQGHRVRVLARSSRRDSNPHPDLEWAIGDLATGRGLQAALEGVHTVINAATFSPIARRGGIRPVDFITSPSEVDVEGTERLLALSRTANVR